MNALFDDDQREASRRLKPGERDDEGLKPEAVRDHALHRAEDASR